MNRYDYDLNTENIRNLGYILYTNPAILRDYTHAKPFIARPPNQGNVFSVIWRLAKSFFNVF